MPDPLDITCGSGHQDDHVIIMEITVMMVMVLLMAMMVITMAVVPS